MTKDREILETCHAVVLWVTLLYFSHFCPTCLLQINVGTTVTMTGNGTRPPPTPSAEASAPGPGQASPLAPSSATVESTEGAPPLGPAPPPTASHPRVIRISHQSVEPVVMMHMNIQGELGSEREREGEQGEARAAVAERSEQGCVCGEGSGEQGLLVLGNLFTWKREHLLLV